MIAQFVRSDVFAGSEKWPSHTCCNFDTIIANIELSLNKQKESKRLIVTEEQMYINRGYSSNGRNYINFAEIVLVRAKSVEHRNYVWKLQWYR